MNVDYLTLACLRDQLDSLLGAHVQRVVLPDELSIGLELYAGQRAQLLLSADPQHPRALLAPQKLRRSFCCASGCVAAGWSISPSHRGSAS
jgi:predicted ribosome quality control (RQC) complex YloA/Tae2 family protein